MLSGVHRPRDVVENLAPGCRPRRWSQVSSCSEAAKGSRSVAAAGLPRLRGWFADAGVICILEGGQGSSWQRPGTVQGGEPLGSRATLALSPEAGPEPGLHEQLPEPLQAASRRA